MISGSVGSVSVARASVGQHAEADKTQAIHPARTASGRAAGRSDSRQRTMPAMRAALLLLLVGCGAPSHPAPSTATETASNTPSDAPTYEAWIEANGLLHAPVALWIEAGAPLVGSRVRWPLQTWGGESTIGPPFRAPNGWSGSLRSRFVSYGLPDLAAVQAAGSAVVHCPGAVDPGAPLTASVLDGIFLGVMEREGAIEVWLGDCAVHP